MSKQRKKGWKNEEYFFGFFLVKAGIEKPQIENIYRKKWDWREQHPGMVDLVTIKGKRSGLIIELDPDEDFQRVLNRFVEIPRNCLVLVTPHARLRHCFHYCAGFAFRFLEKSL
jgi:hypothetical protein